VPAAENGCGSIGASFAIHQKFSCHPLLLGITLPSGLGVSTDGLRHYDSAHGWVISYAKLAFLGKVAFGQPVDWSSKIQAAWLRETDLSACYTLGKAADRGVGQESDK